MDCRMIEASLVGFHFGTLDAEERRAVEDHLPACGACVRAVVELKRAAEGDAGPAPSDMARLRLRKAVDKRLSQRRRRTALRTLAAAAVLALTVGGVISLRAWRASDTTAHAAHRSLDDSATLAPASLDVL